MARKEKSERGKRERVVEEELLNDASVFGYSESLPIRHVEIAEFDKVRPDLILLPRPTTNVPVRLVLIECKDHDSPDLHTDPVAQLIKYYSYALTLGSSAIDAYRDYAAMNPSDAQATHWTTLTDVFGRTSITELSSRLHQTPQLQPHEIALVLVLDGPPSKRLELVRSQLYARHGFRMDIIKVVDGCKNLIPPLSVEAALRLALDSPFTAR
jgi:hypothetical protein